MNPLEHLLNTTITCHTVAGNFTGKLVWVTPSNALVLFDSTTVHVVFDDGLSAITSTGNEELMQSIEQAAQE